MRFSDFYPSFVELVKSCRVENLDRDARYVFMSDLHMGDGGGNDDLVRNRELVQTALARRYLERGYVLVLNGDIEDLSKYRFSEIRAAWPALYAIIDAFAARGALRKIVGNHDLGLFREKEQPYELLHGLVLERDGRKLFAFHGHQASRFFVRHSYLSDFIVRYLAKPLRIRNTGISADDRYRFKAERRIYRASKMLGMLSIMGHTHRPLFESHSKYDSLRWSIEELVREYPGADPGRRAQIASSVSLYRSEFERLGRKELRFRLSRSLYDDCDLLIPCLFNSGCATGRKGMTALEIEGGRIGLVHWSGSKRPREYIEMEAIRRDEIEGTGCARYLLKQVEMDEVFARIDLLGQRA
ncbi:MAG: metallophosphoesterase family protein [Spirochaetes bacterium]|nr:metallophosphoesterase family protein [Spirochaetota bacterium]